jgi:hypothetical protein
MTKREFLLPAKSEFILAGFIFRLKTIPPYKREAHHETECQKACCRSACVRGFWGFDGLGADLYLF